MLGRRLPDPKILLRAAVNRRKQVSDMLDAAWTTGDRKRARELQTLLKQMDQHIKTYGPDVR
jgi:hypothetical protein